MNLSETGKTGLWIDFENMNIAWDDMMRTEKVKSHNFFGVIEKVIEGVLGAKDEVASVRIFFSEIDLFNVTSLIFDEEAPLWKRYKIHTPYQNINDTLDLRYIEGKVKRPAKRLEFIQCWMKGKIDHGTLKSTLDTWLVTDIISTLYENKELKNFVVVSGDADYAPALRHLMAKGKKVIVIFDENSASQHLRQDVQDRLVAGSSYRFVGLRQWLRSHRS